MANPSNAIRPKFELYDINNNPEHDLFEDYIVEFVDVAGFEIDYYRLKYTDVPRDRLYGEPQYQNIEYDTAARTKMVYEVTDEPTLTSNFGTVSEDLITFGYIPVFTFNRDVSETYTPQVGDVIRVLWNSRTYKVVDAKREEHVFQAYKFIYNFILKPYRFSSESDTAAELSLDIDDTLTNPTTAYGDNQWIDDQSDTIDDYGDVDTGVYGY